MKAAIYLRVSTEDQAQKYSLDAQREACRRRAVELGALDVLEFSDPGVSGELLERPGLGALRSAMLGGEVALVVVLDPDRLARKLGLQILLTEEIERAGVRLDFVEFEWKNTAEGQLYYHMRGAFAQYEKAKIKRRTAYGRQQKAKRGELPLRFQPYGYRFDPVHDTLQVAEPEAGAVRDMYRWVIDEGLGPHAIAARLQALGVAAPGGGRVWYRSTVARLLRNPVYAGRFLANRFDCTGMGLNRHLPAERRVRPKERPLAEWIAVPVPPLVGQTVWDRVQEALRRPQRGRADYLLTGLVACGECGAPMHGCRTYRRYYTCRSTDGASRRGCGQWAPAAEVEEQVWGAVWQAVYDSVLFAAAARELASGGLRQVVAAEQERLQAALRQKERARQAYLQVMAVGALEPGEAAAGLQAINGEIEWLRERLTAVGQPPVEVAWLGGAGAPELGYEDRRLLLRQAVERVTIHRDRVVLGLRVEPAIAPGCAEPILHSADADEDHERGVGQLLAQPDHAGDRPDGR
jgi:site-specific DNA recombinase